MSNQIQNLRNQAIAQITDAENPQELEEIRVKYLGRKGEINRLMQKIPTLKPEERGAFGKLVNEAKKTIEEALESKTSALSTQHSALPDWFDVTQPGYPVKIGHLHPTTIVINQMFDIFKHLGFSVAVGPEIENEKFNFELLNLPPDHPARSLQDTLTIKDADFLLRPHTSSIEARILDLYPAPFRVVAAGKCYRYEAVNPSNNAVFYQFQGVALQEGLSMADLKGTLVYFVKAFLGKDRQIRFRCKYYPEVEPGGGLDVDCPFCHQKGCPVCKGRGWLELLGCGMIHPNILKNFGYNPNQITGFAFGMGLDRIVMDRFKIHDIRSLYNGDIYYQA